MVVINSVSHVEHEVDIEPPLCSQKAVHMVRLCFADIDAFQKVDWSSTTDGIKVCFCDCLEPFMS